MADQKRWFKVWTSIIANGHFAEMSLEDIGRWTLLGAATALDGDKGRLGVPGEGKELCRLLRVPNIDVAKEVLKSVRSVSFEECKNRDGEHSVTWRNWHTYQEDSTAAKRMKTLRSKRRGEEKRGEEKKRPPLPPIGGGPELEKAPVSGPAYSLPDWFQEVLKQSRNFRTLLNGKHMVFWESMSVAYDPYTWLKWDEQIQKADAWIEANPQRRPRQVARFLRNWFERAVERGRRNAESA